MKRHMICLLLGVSGTILISAARGDMPDPDLWTVQPLSTAFPPFNRVEISDQLVAWEEDGPIDRGVSYYDGTGIYQFPSCSAPAVHGSELVCVSGGNILYWDGHREQVIPSVSGQAANPAVYDSTIFWEEPLPGSDYPRVYYHHEGLTFRLADNAKTPQLAAEAIAWLGHDGDDWEIFLLKEGEVRQLTSNHIDEEGLRISDNGHLAWETRDSGDGLSHAHYYDGQNFYQLTVSPASSSVRAVTETGVLYAENSSWDDPTSLKFFDGTETVLLDQFDAGYPFLPADAGGGSVAWYDVDGNVIFDNGQDRMTWKAADWLDDHPLVVWGNRLVWISDESLYFGRYHGSPACVDRPRMDADGNCRVDLADLGVFAAEWLTCGYDDPAFCWQAAE